MLREDHDETEDESQSAGDSQGEAAEVNVQNSAILFHTDHHASSNEPNQAEATVSGGRPLTMEQELQKAMNDVQVQNLVICFLVVPNSLFLYKL